MTTNVLDPNDTGEILADGGLAPAVTETARITYDEPTDHLFAEGTRDLTHHAVNGRRPAAHPELAHDTGELPLTGPTGAERAVAARHVQQPRPGQPSGPATPTGPTSPPSGPPPPVATDEKPPPTMPTPAPPKPSWTGEARELPTVRPAVPRVRTDRDPGRRRAGVGWPSVAALAVGLTVLIELALVGVSALLGVQW
jgi:hypothetical protein